MRKWPPVIERLSARIALDEQTGCWLWQGAKNPNGYGVTTHCPRDHEYTPENTRMIRAVRGTKVYYMRQCKTCHRDRERARREAVGTPVDQEHRSRTCRRCGVPWSQKTPGCAACGSRYRHNRRMYGPVEEISAARFEAMLR